MSVLLRTAVWAACLPLLWPPGVCPHHGPAELITGSHEPAPADEPCCPACDGADQSRLVEPAVAFALDLPAAPLPSLVSVSARSTPVPRPAPPPDPSPPLYLTLCRLAC